MDQDEVEYYMLLEHKKEKNIYKDNKEEEVVELVEIIPEQIYMLKT